MLAVLTLQNLLDRIRAFQRSDKANKKCADCTEVCLLVVWGLGNVLSVGLEGVNPLKRVVSSICHTSCRRRGCSSLNIRCTRLVIRLVMRWKSSRQLDEVSFSLLLRFAPSQVGPTYVCLSFATFVCTTCGGLHREFSHKVKAGRQ